MICSRLLKPHGEAKHGRVFAWSERVFTWVMGHYERSLAWVLRHQRLTLAVTLGTMAATVALYAFVPKGFFPQQDTGRLAGTLLASQDVSFQGMKKFMHQFSAIVQADPQPADFQIKDQVLTILDAKGRELWSYDTEREHLKSEAFYREHFQIQRTVDDGPVFPYLIIKDLDGDGKIETLFAAQVVNDVDTGPLLCFDRRGELKWRYEPGRRMTFGSTEYSNDYWLQLMGLCDLEDDGKLEIIQHRTFEHQLTIAMRKSVSEAVSDALVETGNTKVIQR